MPDFVIRGCTSTDEGFVAKSWVDTARGGTRQSRNIESSLFNQHHYQLVGRILERAEIRIAAPPDDDVTIYGFSVLEPGLIHVVYVKKPWRRLGIGRALLAGVPLDGARFSTWSQDFSTWIFDKHPTLKHLPFYMERDNGGASESPAAKRKPESADAARG